MSLIIKKDSDELSRELAGWIITYIEKKLQEQDRFSLVLSGGSTPKKLYRVLASDPYKSKIDWRKMHIFWGDERYVPFSDERNNARMAFENLLDHVPVPAAQVHVMRTDIEPEVSAIEYEKILRENFTGTNRRFDLVLLGLGEDAHTLSLFPGYDIVGEKQKWVRSFYAKEQKTQRITLTSPVVNAAGCIVFLVSGAEKAVAIQHVLEGSYDPGQYPAQAIQPVNGELYWWTDEAAAALLSTK